jgi:hypothetical protein
MKLIPAYGRDYRSAKKVLKDFNAGKDFLVADHFSPYDGKPCNIDDLRSEGRREVTIRFHQLTKLTKITIPPKKTSEKKHEIKDTILRDEEPEPRYRSRWPEPTTEEPTDDELREMVFDSVCDATDGCMVEPDGICEHGHPSWLLKLGLI